MTKQLSLKDISGAFGGGSSPEPSYQPYEADDTLRSKQVVRILLAISEGQIESIDEILLNNVSIDNYDASWDWRSGVADQIAIEGFIDTEEPVPGFVPTLLTQYNPIFTTVSYAAAACRITLSLQALKSVTPQNDTIGYRVQFRVETRPDSAALWTTYKVITKSGKASSSYSWDTRVDRPSGTTVADSWEIRVTRLTVDDTSKEASASTWSAATTLYELEETYPNTALLGITLKDAAQFGNSVPEIRLKAKGIKVKIPTNYDPVTHLYDESIPWDGSLTETIFYYTANPAWHIYKVLNEARYDPVTGTGFGLGIAKYDIDVIALYNLSKYADTLADDGKGGTEYRYELSNQFIERADPQTFLMYLLNICNANLTTNEFGQISFMFDHPGQLVTKNTTVSNVIDGAFNYSSNDLESRFNLVNVTYNREDFNGDTDTATWVEESLMDRYGLQTSDIVLPGCTREAAAIRKARWAVYQTSYLPNVVNYSKLFAGLTYHVGELDRVYDNLNQSNVQSGIIQSYSEAAGTTTFQLDREVTLDSASYDVTFMALDGTTEETYAILESGATVTSVSFIGIAEAAVNSTFILTGPLTSRVYKVVRVTKTEDTYEITSIQHDEAKYAYIDQTVVLAEPAGDFVDIKELITHPASLVTVVENFASNGVTQKSSLDISWTWDRGSLSYEADYKLSWKRDGQENHFIPNTTGKGYDILNPVPGLYEIAVWAINPFTGIASTAAIATYNFRTAAAESSLQPPIEIYVAGTTGLIFAEQDLHLAFSYDPANTNVSDILLDYTVEVWDETSATLKGNYVVKPNELLGGNFSFPYTENRDLFGVASPARTFNLKLRSRDVMGDLSLPIQVQLTNPAPPVVSFTVISGSDASYLTIDLSGEPDIAGYLVHRSSDPIDGVNFIPSPATLVYDDVGRTPTIQGDPGSQYFFKVAAYDTFSKSDIIYSAGQGTNLTQGDVPLWVFTGLIFNPNTPAINSVYWSDGTASLNGDTPIAINEGDTSIAPWVSGIQYFYYDGVSSHLSVTTDITIAVTGAMILATYKGGTSLIVGNGAAYTDGNLIIANTVGANQLVVDSAIITNTLQLKNLVVETAALADGSATNLKIGSIIESSNYDPSLFLGWQLNKAGDFTAFGDFSLYNNAGEPILLAGDVGPIQWPAIGGAGKPEDNATVGASIDSNLTGTFTTDNIGVYMPGAAIGNLQFDRATGNKIAVATADIVDLAVQTLKIADNAVTISEAVILAAKNLSAITEDVGSLTITNTTNEPIHYLITSGISTYVTANTYGGHSVGGSLFMDGVYLANYLVAYITYGGATRAGFCSPTAEITVPANSTKIVYLRAISTSAYTAAFYFYGGYINAIGLKK